MPSKSVDQEPELGREELNLLFSGYLFFGRPFAPETLSTGEVEPKPLAHALFASRRFLVEVAEPILDGSFLSPHDPVPAAILLWAEAAFNMQPASTMLRLELLARVLESQFARSEWISDHHTWSARGLAAACHRMVSNAQIYDSASEQIQNLAHGVSHLRLSNILENETSEGLAFTSDEASITFELDRIVASRSPTCRLDFGFNANSNDPTGRLYLDYGPGLSEVDPVPLMPRGRSRYSAFVVTEGLKAIGWNPDRSRAGGVVSLLTARPLDRETIDALVIANSSQKRANAIHEAFGRLEKQADVALASLNLSKILTEDLGGHLDPASLDPQWRFAPPGIWTIFKRELRRRAKNWRNVAAFRYAVRGYSKIRRLVDSTWRRLALG